MIWQLDLLLMMQLKVLLMTLMLMIYEVGVQKQKRDANGYDDLDDDN